MKKLVFVVFLCILFTLYLSYGFNSTARYTVVIDPGHGGLSLNPVSIHGDKYDSVQKKYLAAYQEGASYQDLYEGEIAYEIALSVKQILDLTGTSEGRIKFRKILLKYAPTAYVPKEPVKVIISREKGYSIGGFNKFDKVEKQDYNAPFRLFDFPDINTLKKNPGLISRINSETPDLVVSIHLDSDGPTNGAMAPVVTPGYETFKIAGEYLKADLKTRKNIQNDFLKSPYVNWVQMNGSRTSFEWFLCDSWIYFTGYWSYKNGLMPDPLNYRGLRQNMVTWAYEGKSRENQNNSNNTPGFDSLNLEDSFWQRELSEPEKWRREGGTEGVGGDNLFSANEILRFIRLGLLVNNSLSETRLPDIREPHWSTWSMPTYVNAVNAFLELGFLNNRYDRERIVKYETIHAEAIAVGIYSLLYGLKINDHQINGMPTGNPVNLEKYKHYHGTDYFKSVIRRP